MVLPYPQIWGLDKNVALMQDATARPLWDAFLFQPYFTMRIPIFIALSLMSLAATASAQFAPTSLGAGYTVNYDSTVNDSLDGVYREQVTFRITSSSEFTTADGGGTYTYTKTGANTATLTYHAVGGGEQENATVQATFTSTSGGSFTSSGSYTGSDEDGPYSGTFTSSGTFTYLIPAPSVVPAVSDDFNDNSKNTTKWGTDISGFSTGVFTEVNQRLEYSASTAAERNVFRPWNITAPLAYDRSWEVVVDAVNTLALTGVDGEAGVGLGVFPPVRTDKFVELGFYASREDGVNSRMIFSEDDGSNDDAAVTSTTVALRIAYNSSTKLLTCYYDTDGAANGYIWLPVGSYSTSTWGMSGSQSFRVAAMGYSIGTSVTSVKPYLDDFRITGPDSTLDAWKRLHFGDPATADAGDLEDQDKDGIKNLVEYASGLNPKSNGVAILVPGTGTSGLPYVSTTGSAGAKKLRLEFVRRKSSTTPGITYAPQFSDTLLDSGTGAWQTAGGTATVTSIDANWERVVIEDTTVGSAKRFGRVLITRP